MIRNILSLILCLTLGFFPCIAEVLDSSGKPSQTVVEIFSIFDQALGDEPNLNKYNQYAQSRFLRPKNAERDTLETKKFYQQLLGGLSKKSKEDLLTDFDNLEFVRAIYPHSSTPNYILVMGSTVMNQRYRIKFLNDLVATGNLNVTDQTQIVFLVGDRPLFDSETSEAFMNPSPEYPVRQGWVTPKELPKNELDIPEFLWDQMLLDPKLRKAKPIFIQASKRKGTTRSDTGDTVVGWIDQHQVKPGLCLIISSNPHILRQKLVVETLFNNKGFRGFSFDAAGPAYPLDKNDLDGDLGQLLDTLARTLYQEVTLRKLISQDAPAPKNPSWLLENH